MNNLPKPQDILDNIDMDGYASGGVGVYGQFYYTRENILDAMKEYGRQVRDKTLEWAAKNAETELYGLESNPSSRLDRGSILNGKISKDLEI